MEPQSAAGLHSGISTRVHSGLDARKGCDRALETPPEPRVEEHVAERVVAETKPDDLPVSISRASGPASVRRETERRARQTAAHRHRGTVVPDPVPTSAEGARAAQQRSSEESGSALGGAGCASAIAGQRRKLQPHSAGRRATTSTSTGNHVDDQVSRSIARPSRASFALASVISPGHLASIASPRAAAVAAATCCGSRRTVDTAERLVLPPRRAHCIGSTGRLRYEHRQEAIVTWVVAVCGVLGLPLIVSCAYALLLSLQAEGMDAAARVQLPWIQLSAVATIGVTFVIVASRAWLRWPARSSSAFCTQLVAATLCVALAASHLYGARTTALAVIGEPVQPIPAGAAGSLHCAALEPDDLVGGFCDVSTRVVAVPVGSNGTMLGGIDAQLRGLLQASHAAVLASSLLVGAQVSRNVVDRCVNDALMPWLCESALPTCSKSCTPMKPCRSWCFDIREKCPFLVDELQQFVQPDGALDTIIYPPGRREGVFGAYFHDLLSCGDGEHWVDGETCSAPAASVAAAETASGPCDALLRSAAAVLDSPTAAPASQRWLWTAILTMIAAVMSVFGVVVALFCGEFVPIPYLLRHRGQQPVPFAGAPADGRNSEAFSAQATNTPAGEIWSPTESASLDSNGSRSGRETSPSSNTDHNRNAVSDPGGASNSAAAYARPMSPGGGATLSQLPLSPASTLRAGLVGQEMLATVNESHPQSPEVVRKTTWVSSPVPFRRVSPFNKFRLLEKSPAVLMRRVGIFKGGERGRIHSASARRTSQAEIHPSHSESEPDERASRLLNPSARHVLDYRNFVASGVLGCSGVCLLQLGLVAEYAAKAGSSAAFDVAAVVSIGVTMTSLIDWRFIYAEGVSVYRHGERRYERMRAADTASRAARVRFRLRWLRARWRELFGLRGRYFKQRLILTEAVEIIVQVIGLLDRLDAAANSEIVFVVSLLVVNIAGGAVLHFRDSITDSAEVSLLFELVCDVVFLIHLVVVVSSDTVAITPTQVVGLLVPSFVTLITIRTLNRVVIMRLAASDAAAAGVVKHLGASTTNTRRQLRIHVDGRTAGPEQQAQAQWNEWEQRAAVVVKVTSDPRMTLRSCPQRLLRCCRKAYLWVVLILFVPISVATIVRLVVADAACAARVGPLWSGVTASSKSVLAGGFFSEPACPVEQVAHLDLRDANVPTIGEDILQFTALQEIDARGNEQLLHVSAAVAKLPALERLRLDGTAAARSILWGSANLTEFPGILRSVSEVELLDLSGNHISVVDDADVAALESLHTLILSDNALTALPEGLGTHSRLRVLLASNNLVSGVSQGLVPLIERLDALDLSNNQLSELPAALGSHVFDYLNVSGNNVTELHWGASNVTDVPSAIFDLPLRALVLSENGLRDIPPEISRLSQLEFLDVSRNALTALPEGMGQLQNLRTLIAHTNYLYGAATSSVWDSPKLVSADFACCSLCTVPDSVWLSSTLQHLDLSFNPLGSSGISSVPAELVTSPLRSVNLQSTSIADVPTVLLDSVVHDTLQGVVLPMSVDRADPNGAEALNLPCSPESDGVEESLRCGRVPENWPRTNVRATCAFSYAPQAARCPIVNSL